MAHGIARLAGCSPLRAATWRPQKTSTRSIIRESASEFKGFGSSARTPHGSRARFVAGITGRARPVFDGVSMSSGRQGRAAGHLVSIALLSNLEYTRIWVRNVY